MNKFIKVSRWILGSFLLLMIIFPHLFLPAGVTCAVLIGIFEQVCGKNTSGAIKIYLADKASVTVILETSLEISTLTGATAFMKIDVMQDSLSWAKSGERVGLNNWKITNTIDFDVMPPSLATNVLLQALIDGSPCGFYAIIVDGNSKCWLVGYNHTDTTERPLTLGKQEKKTGKGLGEADGNTVHITLTNVCGGLALPFDTTLSGTIIDLSADFLKLT